AGTDPSVFVKSIVHLNENETALYVRGDDMADFPSKHVVEELSHYSQRASRKKTTLFMPSSSLFENVSI
ncbi:unnamed protein product, partial [Rotaria socialis]